MKKIDKCCCPFCGWGRASVNPQRVGTYRRTGTKFQVVCGKCYGRGARHLTEEDAEYEWRKASAKADAENCPRIAPEPSERKILNPLSPTGKIEPISSVLRSLASQEHCDGDPYDQMIEAAEHIDDLTCAITSRHRTLNLEVAEELGLLLMDGFDDYLIGYVERCGMPPVACYDKDKVLAALMSEGMDQDEAL